MSSLPALTICGVEYLVSFAKPTDCGGPCLTLTSSGGSGGGSGASVSYKGVLECCGCSWAIFAFGDPDLCSGTRDPAGPCANLLRIKVEYHCCPIDGYDGPGWYCVRAAGGSDLCFTTELLDGDECDPTIEICSGPYADEAAAAAVCYSITEGGTSCAVGTPIQLDTWYTYSFTWVTSTTPSYLSPPQFYCLGPVPPGTYSLEVGILDRTPTSNADIGVTTGVDCPTVGTGVAHISLQDYQPTSACETFTVTDAEPYLCINMSYGAQIGGNGPVDGNITYRFKVAADGVCP